MPESSSWGELPTFEKPSSGSWLYKQGSNLYGPIPTDVLLDRIRKGKLNDDIVVAEDGTEDFISITEHPVLKADAEKAFEAAKELRSRQQKAKSTANKRTAMVVILAVLAVVLSGGGYLGFRYYEREQALEAWRRKTEADALALKIKQDEERKNAEANGDKDDIDIDLELLPLVSVSQTKKGKKTGKKKANEVDEGPQGCQLDQGSITSTFRGGFGNIKSCIKDSMKRSEQMPESLTLSFTIANTGSVVSFEIDNRSLRGSFLVDCLKKTVTGLHFPKFAGERCNIDYPISIGKKK